MANETVSCPIKKWRFSIVFCLFTRGYVMLSMQNRSGCPTRVARAALSLAARHPQVHHIHHGGPYQWSGFTRFAFLFLGASFSLCLRL